MTDRNDDVAFVAFAYERPNAEPGFQQFYEMGTALKDPDTLDEWLNLFSTILKAQGFTYDAVGVHATLRNGKDIEHWSDY